MSVLSLMMKDVDKRPQLFHFRGSISRSKLETWMRDRALRIPKDLLDLWEATGGGDFFESETILSPFEGKELADDVESVNEWHRGKGLPSVFLVFHTGFGGLSVLNLDDGAYACISEETYGVQDTFESLESWYRCIREEYAHRYGLI
jgi:hypothetical protein